MPTKTNGLLGGSRERIFFVPDIVGLENQEISNGWGVRTYLEGSSELGEAYIAARYSIAFLT